MPNASAIFEKVKSVNLTQQVKRDQHLLPTYGKRQIWRRISMCSGKAFL